MWASFIAAIIDRGRFNRGGGDGPHRPRLTDNLPGGMIVLTRASGGRAAYQNAAEGADIPAQIEVLLAVRAALFERGVTIRANNPGVIHLPGAAGAARSFFQILQQRLFFQ